MKTIMAKLMPLFFIFLSSIHVFGQRKQIKNYYDNDKTQIKELYHTLSNDTSVLDGLYKTYYQDGKVKTVGFYTKSQATDYWEYFYQNGNLKMEGIINNFFNQGHWIFYYENGKKSMEGNMTKGKKNGFWRFYNEDGNIKSEGSIENDKNEGLWKYFNEDGNQKATALYFKGIGLYTENYPNGVIKMQGKIKNNKSDSIWKYYYPSGKLKSTGNEERGIKVGNWKFYYENDSLSQQGEYDQGKTIGIWKYYYDNGKLKAQGGEKDGIKDGFWQMYYPDGKLKAEANYDKGNGQYIEYHSNGRLKAKGNIVNGKYDGLWLFYYENELFKEGECQYSNGEGWYTGMYIDGKKKTEGMLRNGAKVGVWRLYKKDGTLAGFYKTSEIDDDNATHTQPYIVPPQNTTIAGKPVSKIPPKPKKKNIFEKILLYKPDPNIYKTFIIGTDPVQFLSGGLPIFIEYYVQEKFGLELSLTYYKSPFFKNPAKLFDREIFNEGLGYGVRFKKYFSNKDFIGRPYMGGEYRYRNLKYASNYTDTTASIIQKSIVQVVENSHELVLVIGDRFMNKQYKSGISVDIFMGIGIGYKIITPNYSRTKDKDAIFNDIFKNNWYIPFRFGISVGWAF